ncbi:MAG TPA: hypothetical protein VE421_04095 [Burkholderiaceae bacterium]|jgi:hypothetical protein|nr:hypothetical protein [Burkholderiaceae bacterium]
MIGGIAASAGAQVHEPHSQPNYGKPAYGFSESGVGTVIGQLLGNQYSVSDRTAVQHCAIAAIQQAAVQYQPQPSGNTHPYGQGYNTEALIRLSAITDVQRQQGGLHVSGRIDNRFGHPPYGRAHGYQNNGYSAAGDLSFRCNIDHRGIVSDLRVSRTNP